MCEFHGSKGNGFGDIWLTDNPIYFSSIDVLSTLLVLDHLFQFGETCLSPFQLVETCVSAW